MIRCAAPPVNNLNLHQLVEELEAGGYSKVSVSYAPARRQLEIGGRTSFGDEIGAPDAAAVQQIVLAHHSPPPLGDKERRRLLREEAKAANSVAQLRKVVVDMLEEP